MDPHRWEEIRARFDEVVALSAPERLNRLAVLGRMDPELRAAVESLLIADVEAEERLTPLRAQLLALAPAATRRADPHEPLPDLFGLSGRTVSHFRVFEPLGAGGMGVVYRAEDTRLGRLVALKFLLPPNAFKASAKQRFLHEARSAAALDHVNVCSIHEVGETEDGSPFLALALYGGETLKARLARTGPLALGEAIGIARQIAQGLGCAHAAGIVHRDLKPANVMILPDGTVKILDFGLAKVRDESLSASSARLGTASYMSPEQIRGEAADGRADLWALGVVLYEMLIGRKPFAGEQAAAITHAILNEDPVPPSAVRADVPPSVENIVLTLLEKDPTRRYSAAEDVLRNLAAIDSGTFAWPRKRSLMWLRKRAKPGGVTVITFVAVGIGLAFGPSARARRSSVSGDIPLDRSVAVLPFDNFNATKEDEFLAGGLQDAVITQLAGIRDLRVISRQSTRGYAGTAKPLHQIGVELGVGRVVQASVQRVSERVRVTAQLSDTRTGKLLWANRYERKGADVLALENEIALAIAGALEVRLTSSERERLMRPPTQNAEAYNLYLQGRVYQQRAPGFAEDVGTPAEVNVRAAESLFRAAIALDPDFALAHAQLAQVHGDLYGSWYDHTATRGEQMRIEAQSALRLQPNLPEAHLAMGRYWFQVSGDDARALAEFEIARRAQPDNSEMQRLLGIVHRKLGRWEEALADFEQASRLDPRASTILINLAFTYQAVRRFPEAVRAWDRLIELNPDNYRYVMERGRLFVRWQGNTDSLAAALRRIPAGYDPAGQITLAWVDLALLRRRPADALAAFKAMRPELFEGDDYDNIGWLRSKRARAYSALGDSTAAHADLEAALAARLKSLQKQPNDAYAHGALGGIYASLGRKKEAMREARRGMELNPLSRDALGAPLTMVGAAATYARVGEADSAIALLEQLLNTPNIYVSSVASLRLDPTWDPLRSNPRFQRLLVGHDPK